MIPLFKTFWRKLWYNPTSAKSWLRAFFIGSGAGCIALAVYAPTAWQFRFRIAGVVLAGVGGFVAAGEKNPTAVEALASSDAESPKAST